VGGACDAKSPFGVRAVRLGANSDDRILNGMLRLRIDDNAFQGRVGWLRSEQRNGQQCDERSDESMPAFIVCHRCRPVAGRPVIASRRATGRGQSDHTRRP
jgi:hypothetical protein